MVTEREIEIEAEDGTRLFVRDVGSGDPVMLIAGLGGVGAFWDPIVDRLRERFRLIVPDHRGTGRSGRPEAGYRIEVLATDMERVADWLGLGAIALIGHSTGGVIAQRLIHRAWLDVRAAILSATLAVPDAHFELLFRTRLAVLRAAGAAPSAALAHLLGYPPEWIRDNADAVADAVARTSSAEDSLIGAARIQMLLDYCPVGDLATIATPVLVLGSEADVIHPPYHQRALAQAIPGARLRMFPGGHFFPRVDPDAFAATASQFLQEAARAALKV